MYRLIFDTLSLIDKDFLKRLSLWSAGLAIVDAIAIYSIAPLVALGSNESGDTFLGHHLVSDLDPLMVILFVIVINFLSMLLRIYALYQVTFLSQSIRSKVSHLIMRGVLRDGLKGRGQDDYLRILVSEVEQFISSLVQPLSMLIMNLVNSIAILALLFLVNAALATIVVLSALVVVYVIRYFQKPKQNLYSLRRKALNKERLSWIHQAINNWKEAKIYNYSSSLLKDSVLVSDMYTQTLSLNYVLNRIPKPLVEFLLILTIGIVLYMDSSEGTESFIGIASMGVFILALYKMMPAIQAVNLAIGEMTFGRSSLEVINQAVSNSFVRNKSNYKLVSNRFEPQILSLSSIQKTIGKEVLFSDLSLEFSVGNSYAIIGESGSGKSTLVDILADVLEVDTGLMVFRCREDRGLSISYCTQFPPIFPTDLETNISLGRSNDGLEYGYLIKTLGLESLIKRKNNLTSLSLSGGQIQRIGICRALYSRVDVVLFDEPTASIDPVYRQEVALLLKEAKSKSIVICATHDQGLMEKCDFVVSLDKYKSV